MRARTKILAVNYRSMPIADIDARDNGRKLTAGFDLTRLPPDCYADPYPYYRAPRDHEPVKHMPDGSWFLTRYDDIVCILLLNAGHETTTNLIGSALHALSKWPDEKARLIAQIDDTDAMKTVVEEFLRYESSVQLGNRITTADVEVGGFRLPPDSRITIGIGAANRDPAQFPEPDRLNIAREPNRHLAFAFGIHTCAGINLARLEARVALSRFLRRFPRYALTADPVRDRRARFRGFPHLPASVAA